MVEKKISEPEVAEADREQTDGFHLIIDALKLNGVETIYGVPGIPITDFGRMAQAEGIRVISFRHEQNAGNAAAIAGYLTKKPGIGFGKQQHGFPDGVCTRISQWTDGVGQCLDQLFSDDHDLRLVRARDR